MTSKIPSNNSLVNWLRVIVSHNYEVASSNCINAYGTETALIRTFSIHITVAN